MTIAPTGKQVFKPKECISKGQKGTKNLINLHEINNNKNKKYYSVILHT